ncbi:hypothetical protein BOTBODRAFT_88526, partial [Botryobasidium botryosum FD-172 SS1]
ANQSGGPDAIKALIRAGALVDAKDAAGKTPLFLANHDNCALAVLLLLQAGAEPIPFSLDMVMQLLAFPDGPDVVAALLESGWDDPVASCPGTGSPLHRAAYHGLKTTIPILLSSGANPNGLCEGGDCPLHYAVEPPHTAHAQEIIRTLVQAGANADAAGAGGATPLHRAASHGLAPAVRTLLEMGANPSSRDENGQTPLHCVLQSPTPEAAEITTVLLDGGSDMTAADHNKETPLFRGLSVCSPSAVRIMLDRGADVSVLLS